MLLNTKWKITIHNIIIVHGISTRGRLHLSKINNFTRYLVHTEYNIHIVIIFAGLFINLMQPYAEMTSYLTLFLILVGFTPFIPQFC